MKQQLKPLMVGLSLLGCFATPVLANTVSNQQLNKVEQQLTQLQRQVTILKNQSAANTAKTAKNIKSKSITQPTTSPPEHHRASPIPEASRAANIPHTAEPGISGPSTLPTTFDAQYLPVDLDVPGQSFVSSGPYIGVPLEFSGGGLIINSPSVNEDVTLLKLRKNIRERLVALGRPEEVDHSHILLSGIAEGQALYTNRNSSGDSSSDIDLTSANLDVYVLGPSSWTSALLEFSYDNSTGTQTGSFNSNARALDSRVYMKRAFVVLGNFQQSPFYSSFGQMNVPFGQYSSTMISTPITSMLAKTRERAIVVGYDYQGPNAPYASAYIFKGDSQISNASRVNNGGINFGYRFNKNIFSGNVGGGVIANLADSLGMQDTGNGVGNSPLFGGFGGPSVTTVSPTTAGLSTIVNTGNEQLVHRVPAYDLRAQLSLADNVDFLGEYIVASTSFNPNDLSINNHGAKPQALNLEAAYTMPWFTKPTSVSVGYGMSTDALAIGLPMERYSLVFNTSFWRDTLQSLEFRHDINYAASSVSSGSTIAGPTGTGKSVNTVTAQFDIYF